MDTCSKYVCIVCVWRRLGEGRAMDGRWAGTGRVHLLINVGRLDMCSRGRRMLVCGLGVWQLSSNLRADNERGTRPRIRGKQKVRVDSGRGRQVDNIRAQVRVQGECRHGSRRVEVRPRERRVEGGRGTGTARVYGCGSGWGKWLPRAQCAVVQRWCGLAWPSVYKRRRARCTLVVVVLCQVGDSVVGQAGGSIHRVDDLFGSCLFWSEEPPAVHIREPPPMGWWERVCMQMLERYTVSSDVSK